MSDDRLLDLMAEVNPDLEPQGESGMRPFTDFGNAERLVDEHGDDLRYAPGLGWLAWEGRRWRRDADGEVLRRMKATVRLIYEKAARTGDDGYRKALVQHATRSESEARIRAAVSLAETERAVVVDPNDLDADPSLLTVENGTLDLRTGELREHRRRDLISKFAPVEYLPDAHDSLWTRFLERMTGGDAELAAFLRRAIGYSITGDTSEEVLFFAHGPTATSKSTFLEAVKRVLGEYAKTADFETFLKRRGDAGIRNDIARLAGARFVSSVEVDEGKKFAEGLVKMLTGGDTIAARHLYRETFEFRPALKLWLAANDRPRVDAFDSAMWRRIVLVPFTNVVPEAKRDRGLMSKLASPAAQRAILAWAVRGCLEWQQRGLDPPERVRSYTDAYRAEMDPLAGWLADRAELSPQAWSSVKELRESYELWAAANGEKALGVGAAWAKALEARGCQQAKRHGVRGWSGIGVNKIGFVDE